MKRVTRVLSRPNGDVIIDVSFEPSWFGWLFGRKPRTESFRGSCTVWNYYPSGGRTDLWMDGWLYNQWQVWKWNEDDKQARRDRWARANAHSSKITKRPEA